MTTKDKLEGILMAYGLHGIDLNYATSDILALFGVNNNEVTVLPCNEKVCKNPHEMVYRGCKRCTYNKQ